MHKWRNTSTQLFSVSEDFGGTWTIWDYTYSVLHGMASPRTLLHTTITLSAQAAHNAGRDIDVPGKMQYT